MSYLLPDYDWNWDGLAYAEHGLLRAHERFRAVHAYYEPAVALTEYLWWITTLDEWHQRRFTYPHGEDHPRIKRPKDRYRLARNATHGGQIVSALTWARNIAGHQLIDTAEVGWHQLLLFNDLGTRNWRAAEAHHVPSLREEILVWRNINELTRSVVRSDSTSDERINHYAKHLAGMPILDIIDLATSYMVTSEDDAAEHIEMSGVWSVWPDE